MIGSALSVAALLLAHAVWPMCTPTATALLGTSHPSRAGHTPTRIRARSRCQATDRGEDVLLQQRCRTTPKDCRCFQGRGSRRHQNTPDTAGVSTITKVQRYRYGQTVAVYTLRTTSPDGGGSKGLVVEMNFDHHYGLLITGVQRQNPTRTPIPTLRLSIPTARSAPRVTPERVDTGSTVPSNPLRYIRRKIKQTKLSFSPYAIALINDMHLDKDSILYALQRGEPAIYERKTEFDEIVASRWESTIKVEGSLEDGSQVLIFIGFKPNSQNPVVAEVHSWWH